MAVENQFYLFKRKLKKKDSWYVCFINPADGKQGTAKSIEALRKALGLPGIHHVTRKSEASMIAQEALETGHIDFDDKTIFFKKYVLDHWDFDNSPFIQRKNKKCPNSIGRDYALNMRGTFRANVAPMIADTLKLKDVSTELLEEIIGRLLDEGKKSNGTIARIMQSIAGPLKEARRLKLIRENPMTYVEPVTVRSKKRGILTSSELHTLLEKMANRIESEEVNELIYLATALSAMTGMRQGELRGLEAKNIQLIDKEQGIITVKQAYASYAGMKDTKGKRERQVPAPRWLCEKLLQSAERSPYDHDMVFWSAVTKKSPVTSNFIRYNFYKALELVGIDEEIRARRNITFHSLRHYFVTYMRGKISESALREIAGHQSSEMTDLYTHYEVEQLLEVGKISKNILPFPSKKGQTA